MLAISFWEMYSAQDAPTLPAPITVTFIILKFKFDKSKRDLVIVQGPVKNEEDILEIITRIDSISSINFNLSEINYSYVNGWDVITDKTLIRFGNDLTETKFKNFEYTANYLFENGKNPSIIDIRYRDGVALNYGK